MEKEKDNYYRFISVIYEVGGDVQRFRLKRSYISSNFQTLSHFLNDRDVLHTLFHLFYPTHLCCWKGCCKTQRAKGFSTNQWDILYDTDPSLCCKQNKKICMCCVTAKNVSESDLDLSLLSLILNHCCNLTPNEKIAVQSLRDMKNNYISHKPNMSLSDSDFQSLWYQVEHHIKHLDSTNTYLYQQQNLLHRPMDVSLMQMYFINCLDASAQLDSEMRDLHASIDRQNESVIETINDNFNHVNSENKRIIKALNQLQSTKEYKQSESKNEGDCITKKRKRHELAVCSDLSKEEEDINADNYMSKKRNQQNQKHLNLFKGNTDDLRFQLPDTKPLDNYKEYISSNLLGPEVPTSFSLQMNYQVCTIKDLSKQPGFKEANKFICGKCCWLTISLDEFLKHVQLCEMRKKENIKVKNDYKNYVVARITVPTKDKNLSSKIEKEWQQGNINPQHSLIDVNYITTACVEIWVKVDLLLFVNNTSKFYSALDNLVNNIFQKYALNLPLSRVEVYDVATGYVDNLADEFHCGDCELKCNTLDNFISHKKTRCFQHILPEKLFSSASFLPGWISQNSGSSPLTDIDLPVNKKSDKKDNEFSGKVAAETSKPKPKYACNLSKERDLNGTTLCNELLVTLNEEEENYVRMSLLLTGISQRAVRTLFEKEFYPARLYTFLKEEHKKLLDLRKIGTINQSQWNLLFPRIPDVLDSKTFDVTLMTALLRNLTKMTPPLCGLNCLPTAKETTPAADLARIKHYRNYLAHLNDDKIGIASFNTAWDDITSAIERLGGLQMKLECDHMKTKLLDSTNQNIMMDIKCSISEIRDMRKSLKMIQQSHIEMKTVPKLLQEKPAVLRKEIEEIEISQNDTVPLNDRENQADSFEKKNNLAGITMTKEEHKEGKEVNCLEDNSVAVKCKGDNPAVVNCKEDIQTTERKISNQQLDDLTSKVSDIHIADKKEVAVGRQNTVEDDTKRQRNQTSLDNDKEVQKKEGALTARGPNGVRTSSYDNFANNLDTQQPEYILGSYSNKDGYSEETEPAKYYKPVVDYFPSQSHVNVKQLAVGTVTLKTPPIQHHDEPSYTFYSIPEGDLIETLLAEQEINIRTEFSTSNIPVNMEPTKIFPPKHVKEENVIIDDNSSSPYSNGGPSSNQSDSGISGMSYGSPYQNLSSPQYNASPPSPVMYHSLYSDVQDLMDPILGREEDFQDVQKMIAADLLRDNKPPGRVGEQKKAEIPHNYMMTNQMNLIQHFQMNTQHCPISTHNTMQQHATIFGHAPMSTNNIILPPCSQPSAAVHPIPVSNPVMMVPPESPIPIGPVTPFTQPQIIIMQPGPIQAQMRPDLLSIAPKTDKQTNKKPVQGPVANKEQKQPSRPDPLPVMQVRSTPSQIPNNAQQRPSNNQNNAQKRNLLNIARRMVAEIPSEQLRHQDDEGNTYLHAAACRSDPNLIQSLLERLNQEQMIWLIELENKKRMTPLYLAVLGNQPEMVEIFLKNYADPNALAQSISSPTEGQSLEVMAPIHVASAGGEESLPTLKKLLSVNDISLNIYNSEGHTALHTAIIAHGTKRQKGSYINSLNTIEALIKAGADPNSQDKKSGKTPLMYAIEKRDCILIEKMLRFFDPKKLSNVIKASTFDGSNCLEIAEGRKSEFNPQEWQRLWDLLNKALTGELPRTVMLGY